MIHEFWKTSDNPNKVTFEEKYCEWQKQTKYSSETLTDTQATGKIYVSNSIHFTNDTGEMVDPVEYTLDTFNSLTFTGSLYWQYGTSKYNSSKLHFYQNTTSNTSQIVITLLDTGKYKLEIYRGSTTYKFTKEVNFSYETYTAASTTPEILEQTLTNLVDLRLRWKQSTESALLDSSNIVSGSLTYNKDVNAEESYNVGTVSMATITLTILNINDAYLKIGNELNYFNRNNDETLMTFVGRYKISSVEKVNSKTNITLVDGINDFDEDVSDWCNDISGGGEYKWNKWTFDTATVNLRVDSWSGSESAGDYIYYDSSLKYSPTSTALNYQLSSTTSYVNVWRVFNESASIDDLKNKYIYFNAMCLVKKKINSNWVEVPNDFMVYKTGEDITVDTTAGTITFNSLTPVSIINIEKLSSTDASAYSDNLREGDYYYYKYYSPSSALLPCTLFEFAGYVCSHFGYTFDNQSLRNGDFIVTPESMTNANCTGKDLLRYIGECSGNFVQVVQNEEYGTLTKHIEMRTYDTTYVEETLNNSQYTSFDVADYSISVSGVWIDSEEQNKSTEVGGGNNEVYIQGNPIFQKSNKAYLGDEARSIYYKLIDLGTYYPAKVTTLVDYRIEVGDIIIVKTKSSWGSGDRRMLVMSKEINSKGITLTCKGSYTKTL